MRAALIAAILHMMGRDAHVYRERAAAFAFHAERAIAAERSTINPRLLSAVAGKESSWRWEWKGAILTGKHGDSGYMQVTPPTVAELCRGLDVKRPVDNIRCGLRKLHAVEAECGGEPANWLGRYNGQPCGPSEYGRRVLAIMARGAARSAPVLTDVVSTGGAP